MLRFVGTKDVQALGISSDFTVFFHRKRTSRWTLRIWRANKFFPMFWSWYGLVDDIISLQSYHDDIHDDIHVDIDFSSAQVTFCWSGTFFESPYSWPASWPGLGAGIGQWLRPPGLQLQSKKPFARQGVPGDPGSSAGLWAARIFGQTVYSHNIASIYIASIYIHIYIWLEASNTIKSFWR